MCQLGSRSLVLFAVALSAHWCGTKAFGEPVVTEVREGNTSILKITDTDGAESNLPDRPLPTALACD